MNIHCISFYIYFAGISGKNEGFTQNQQIPAAGQCEKASARRGVDKSCKGGVEPRL